MGRKVVAWAAVAVLAGATTPAVATAQERVSSGSLAASVEADPWRLSFLARSGGRETLALAESRSRDSGPTGALGFRTALGWRRTTRVVESRRDGTALVALLATNDPGGRRISVRLEPAGEGSVRLSAAVTGGGTGDVTATGIAFDARGAERYLGFGERSNGVDQRGREVENFVSDGPYHPEDRVFLAAFVPPQGFRSRDDATYFPMPWLLSTAGYGVLVDNHETSLFRLGSADRSAWSVEVEAPTFSMRVFAGPEPADVLRRVTAHLGRQPPPAAPWFMGPWFQPRGGVDAQLADVKALQDADAPVSVANTYLHYLPCGDQQGVEAEERRRVREIHARGLAITTYFNPMVCTSYGRVFNEAAARGALTKDSLGRPYTYRYTSGVGPDREFMVGQFDFSAPAGVSYFGELLAEAVADGHDGWMEDFGEYTPPDARSADGTPGPAMHNLYPTLYHKASYEFARRQAKPVAGYIRSGWTGVQPYAQLVWGGDPTVDWGFDGLSSAVTQGLTMGLSGISRWGSDIGGFFAINQRSLSPELLKRWIQFGAVSGVMRTQANGVAVPSKPRPQIPDRDVLPVWRRYAKLRTQLYPYLQAADAEYRRTGMPLMRHMSLAYPADAAAGAREDQFMFGPDLLAAPVTAPSRRERRVRLPAGRWVDLWRSVDYDPGGGGLYLRRRTPLLDGGREASIPAPLDELPLLARAGALLPLLRSDVDTLADYGDGPEVRLSERRRRFTLLAFPRGRSFARFGEKSLMRSSERRGQWRLRVRTSRRTRIAIQASMTTLIRPFRPRCVTVDGKRVKRRTWTYRRDTGALRLRLRTRRKVTRVVASRRPCASRRARRG
jgi:alpha-glucosidase (family GH31 glycosyl hydrolase)